MRDLLSTLRSVKQRVQSLTTPRPEPVDPTLIHIQTLSPANAALVAQHFAEQADPQYAGALAAQAQGIYTVYVAFMQAQPVGLAYVLWAGHRNAQVRARKPGAPEIYKVQVLPAQRSRGIGAVLIRHIEDDMRARGVRVSCLGVHAHNRRAKALYERLGYSADAQPYFDEYDEPDERGQLQHHRIAAVFMTRTLA
jgi:ribosomal protein S18 acetylase RimI-like enzyme